MNVESVIKNYFKLKSIDDWQIEYLLNKNNWIVNNGYQQIALLKDRLLFIDQNEANVMDEKHFDDWGELYEIFQHAHDYIILGELNVLCLAEDYSLKWSFSGRDVFVRRDNKPAVALTEEEITVHDWLGWCYVLDYDGNLLGETCLFGSK